MYLGHQAHRILLRPSPARLRRRLQASARPQCRRRDRGPHRSARRRNMVADFSDIKRLVKGWIDRELDHKMILRHDDPLVAPLQALGEPMYPARKQSDRRADRELIFDQSNELGFEVIACGYGRRRAHLRGTAHDTCEVRRATCHVLRATCYMLRRRIEPSPVLTRRILPPSPSRPRSVRRLRASPRSLVGLDARIEPVDLKLVADGAVAGLRVELGAESVRQVNVSRHRRW